MTLIVAANCRDGIVVSGERLFHHRGPSDVHFGESKLYIGGGRLFTVSGLTHALCWDGKVPFSFPVAVAQMCPPLLQVTDLDAIARLAGETLQAALSMGTLHPEISDECVTMFWLPDRTFAYFVITTSSVSTVTVVRMDTIWPPYVLQGRHEVEQVVIRAGLLTPRSYEFFSVKRPARDIPTQESVAFACDVQAAAARALHNNVGGSVDIKLVAADGTVVEPPAASERPS